MSDPERTVEAERSLLSGYIDLWSIVAEADDGRAGEARRRARPGDKRFADPQWSENQFFDFLKQFYLVTSRWAIDMAEHADGLDPHTRQKAAFYVRQIANALAPSNFVLTNPELLRETLSSNGENLVRGMHMLAEDIEAGHGDLKIRQSSAGDFQLGENLATTPGKVIHQNSLCQIIQYAPTTDTVLKRPLLIVPPWINKFYILDLTPEKSFIRWCVDQGHTVFVISWVNPGKRHARKSFEHYMREGVIEAVDVALEGHRRRRRQRHRLLRRRHDPRGHPRLDGGEGRRSHQDRRPSSPPRSISPMPATSRSSSTRSRSPTSNTR